MSGSGEGIQGMLISGIPLISRDPSYRSRKAEADIKSLTRYGDAMREMNHGWGSCDLYDSQLSYNKEK